MLSRLVGSVYEQARQALAAGYNATFGVLVATTLNGLGVTTGTVAGATPATTFWQVGDKAFASGAGVPTAVDLPVGSLFYNSSAATVYYKWGSGAANWTLLVSQGSSPTFGQLSLTNLLFTTSYIQLVEMTEPAGVAGRATLYTDDDGAGKTRLMVKCGNTAAIQLAIEP